VDRWLAGRKSQGIPTRKFPDDIDVLYRETIEVEVGLFSSLKDALPPPVVVDTTEGNSAKDIAKAAVSSLKKNLAIQAMDFAIVKRYRVEIQTIEVREHRDFSITHADVVDGKSRVIGVVPDDGFKVKNRQSGVIGNAKFLGIGLSTQ